MEFRPDRVDVALIGVPDAGKSTLFNSLTGRSDSLRMPRYSQIKGTGLTIVDTAGITPVRNGVVPGAGLLRYAGDPRLLLFVLPVKGGSRVWGSRVKNGVLAKNAEDYFSRLLSAARTGNSAFALKKRAVVLNCFGDASLAEAEETAAVLRRAGERVFIVNAVSVRDSATTIEGVFYGIQA